MTDVRAIYSAAWANTGAATNLGGASMGNWVVFLVALGIIVLFAATGWGHHTRGTK
jgi:hypothetical protein